MVKKFMQNVVEVLTRPSTAFPRLARENDFNLAAAVLLIVSIITNLLDGGVTIVYGIVMALVFWWVEAGILHALAKMFGVQGKLRRLLIVNAYVALPSVLLVPLSGVGGWELIVLTAGGVWTMYLSYLAIRTIYPVSASKAVIMLFLLYFILAVILAGAGLALI
ncbi:MAG: YIP1 family protein [Selenomonadales bacterium]|nr:YIP1 family protein [Selenomonadales bacterium]